MPTRLLRSRSSRSSATRKAISIATPRSAKTSSPTVRPATSSAASPRGAARRSSRSLEKHGGTLWYACPYEGFEANDHVVYTHACPNQHLVPLLGYVACRATAPNGFLLGSNYIWGWEINRVARDLIADAGGEVLGERYLPLGDTDVARLIDEIRATRPDFILNNLIGPSSYAFLEAYAALGREDPRLHARIAARCSPAT